MSKRTLRGSFLISSLDTGKLSKSPAFSSSEMIARSCTSSWVIPRRRRVRGERSYELVPARKEEEWAE